MNTSVVDADRDAKIVASSLDFDDQGTEQEINLSSHAIKIPLTCPSITSLVLCHAVQKLQVLIHDPSNKHGPPIISVAFTTWPNMLFVIMSLNCSNACVEITS